VGSAEDFLKDVLKHLQLDPEFVGRPELKTLLVNTLEASKLTVNSGNINNVDNLISVCLELPEQRTEAVALELYNNYVSAFEREVLSDDCVKAVEALFS
jgi:hypothetical protein